MFPNCSSLVLPGLSGGGTSGCLLVDACDFAVGDEDLCQGYCPQLPWSLQDPLLDAVLIGGSSSSSSSNSERVLESLEFPCSDSVLTFSSLEASQAQLTRAGTCKEEDANVVEESQRIAFRIKSEFEILDDGYKWKKYGKKTVKNSPNPRNYYRCSMKGCCVKKRIERDAGDGSYVITSYQGKHNHQAPSPEATTRQMTKLASMSCGLSSQDNY